MIHENDDIIPKNIEMTLKNAIRKKFYSLHKLMDCLLRRLHRVPYSSARLNVT